MTRKRRAQSDLGALDMRARVAALETTNSHLAAKVGELSFLARIAARLGSTLDEATIVHDVLDAAGIAADDRTRQRFLLVRVGNAFAYAGGVLSEARDAESYVAAHYDALERCLRVGETVHAGDRVVIPIPGGAHDPGFGCIVVHDAPAAKLGQSALRRLARLAELAGRSFANARVLARNVAAGVTDELTGAYNRRYFDRRLSEELKRARRLNERMSLILLDLDFFKTINDRFGHPEGDRALRAVAKCIVSSVRDIDAVTRWGGEEFAVVVPGADGRAAVVVAERIRDAVLALRLRTSTGEHYGLTVSCGVAWAAADIHTPAQCVAAADRCLLHAKRTGRNRTISMDDAVAILPQGRSGERHEPTPREHRGAARDA